MSAIAVARVMRTLDPGRYQKDTENAVQEPAAEHGMVVEMDPGQTPAVLKMSGGTSPNVGADGPDIPDSAVSNNRVVLYVDGIHTTSQGMETDVQDLLQSSDPPYANVGQTVVGVQEGVSKNIFDDAMRICKDFEVLKGLQAHAVPTAVLQAAAYMADPAIKSVHDEILQSLASGRDVQVVLHSGGGAETAVALSLIAQEDGGRWAPAVAQHVRVLAMAPAAAPQDFEMAGVTPQNLYYTGSHQDPVYTLFHNYIEPGHQKPFMHDALVALQAGLKPGAINFHSPYYMFQNNVDASGQSDIQKYLDGGPGQIRQL